MLNLKRNDRIIVRDVMGTEHELTLVAHSPAHDAARVVVDHSTDDYTIRQFSSYFVRKV